ncbi:MAG: tRNA pseudouridine(13) synthase TruD [Thermoplasmatota archaeon]
MRPHPPEAESALGLVSYLTDVPGVGGHLRSEPEDFQVLETGEGPPRLPDGETGPHTAARVRLRNWETNRFAGEAARRLGIHREQVGFAGMKDKRAVTEQWFTFRAPVAAVQALALSDVQVLEAYPTRKAHFAGAHAGNRFVVRVRETGPDAHAAVESVAEVIRREGGVPNFFGPQRFGGAFRPTTHLVGRALVQADVKEAVRLYVGNPVATERSEAREARRAYEQQGPEAALALFPVQLDPERAILERLVRRPGDWRYALQALPHNLLLLFVHAYQSWLFNLILSARIEAGLGLRTAHVGDRVMGVGDDGVTSHLVGDANRGRVQREIDRGRAVLTAPLIGLDVPLAEGAMGEIERAVLARHQVDPASFRVREMPEVASAGRRRAILQEVQDLDVAWVGDDPVFSFGLGKGSYATVVLREFMKGEVGDY